MKKFNSLVFLLMCTFSVFSVTANANNNGGKSSAYAGSSRPSEGRKVPIDGGIGLLLAAGAALGVRKIMHKRNIPDTEK